MKKLLSLALVALGTISAQAQELAQGKQIAPPVGPAEAVGLTVIGALFALIVYKLGEDTQDGVRYDIMLGYGPQEAELEEKLHRAKLV